MDLLPTRVELKPELWPRHIPAAEVSALQPSGAKKEGDMKEPEEQRGATFLWLLHQIAPESRRSGSSIDGAGCGTRLGGLQQEPELKPSQTGP